IQLCFSCSKTISAIVVARAVDQGRLDYDQKISFYWPEFAVNGKEDITLADALRHEAGLAYFPESLPLSLCSRENLDQLASWIAKQPPVWEWNQVKPVPPGTRIYHGKQNVLHSVVFTEY